ncbi:hypothetical protein JCM1841_000420, partial [Sporobolomyces salmonicolor]
PVPEAPPTHSRLKDRISYSHQLFQVDLTQVTSSGKPQHPTHELEIEFKDAKALLEEAAKEQRGEQSAYVDGVQGLLNNVRESTFAEIVLVSFFRTGEWRRLPACIDEPPFADVFCSSDVCDDDPGMLIRNASEP